MSSAPFDIKKISNREIQTLLYIYFIQSPSCPRNGTYLSTPSHTLSFISICAPWEVRTQYLDSGGGHQALISSPALIATVVVHPAQRKWATAAGAGGGANTAAQFVIYLQGCTHSWAALSAKRIRLSTAQLLTHTAQVARSPAVMTTGTTTKRGPRTTR